MPRRKRAMLSITESMLLALAKGYQLKTHIAYESKIDSRTIERYLPTLIKMTLVKGSRSGRYKITRKGHAFLKQYAQIKKYDKTS